MAKIAFEFPEGALASMRQDAAGFASELRVAAAVKWYETRKLTQAPASEVPGLSRAGFIDALGRYGVSPFQGTVDELIAEATRE